jgi:hypothetical protein
VIECWEAVGDVGTAGEARGVSYIRKLARWRTMRLSDSRWAWQEARAAVS